MTTPIQSRNTTDTRNTTPGQNQQTKNLQQTQTRGTTGINQNSTEQSKQNTPASTQKNLNPNLLFSRDNDQRRKDKERSDIKTGLITQNAKRQDQNTTRPTGR